MSDLPNSRYEITVLADRIFKVKPAEGLELEVNDVREMRAVYLKLSEGRNFAILLDATGNFTPTEEARSLLASEEYTKKRFAAAFVTPNLANKILGNFFIKFNKPASPTRLFNDEASAFAWLLEQREENDQRKT